MDDKRFEHLIQSKLADYEANVPVNLWESIENELPRKKVVPFRRILWTSAAAIIAGIEVLVFLHGLRIRYLHKQ